MRTVGIRELKTHLSSYLASVKRGERIIVSERGKPIASISPADKSMLARRIDTLLGSGSARWSGGKPQGLRRPIRLQRGPTLAETVLADRR
jgi:prevent-host-death family protein